MMTRQIKEDDEHSHLLMNLFLFWCICLKLGLFEQDLADRFGISQSIVSRIFTTWNNLLYLQAKTFHSGLQRNLCCLICLKPFKRDIPHKN